MLQYIEFLRRLMFVTMCEPLQHNGLSLQEVRSSVGPIGVKYIATDEEFDVAIDEAGDRPIVMEFVARKCVSTLHNNLNCIIDNCM